MAEDFDDKRGEIVPASGQHSLAREIGMNVFFDIPREDALMTEVAARFLGLPSPSRAEQILKESRRANVSLDGLQGSLSRVGSLNEAQLRVQGGVLGAQRAILAEHVRGNVIIEEVLGEVRAQTVLSERRNDVLEEGVSVGYAVLDGVKEGNGLLKYDVALNEASLRQELGANRMRKYGIELDEGRNDMLKEGLYVSKKQLAVAVSALQLGKLTLGAIEKGFSDMNVIGRETAGLLVDLIEEVREGAQSVVGVLKTPRKVESDECVSNALICLSQGRWIEAQKLFLDADKLTYVDPIVAYNLGICAVIDGKFDDAESYFKDALSRLAGAKRRQLSKVSLTLANLNYTIAVSKMVEGNEEEAQQKLSKAYGIAGEVVDVDCDYLDAKFSLLIYAFLNSDLNKAFDLFIELILVDTSYVGRVAAVIELERFLANFPTLFEGRGLNVDYRLAAAKDCLVFGRKDLSAKCLVALLEKCPEVGFGEIDEILKFCFLDDEVFGLILLVLKEVEFDSLEKYCKLISALINLGGFDEVIPHLFLKAAKLDYDGGQKNYVIFGERFKGILEKYGSSVAVFAVLEKNVDTSWIIHGDVEREGKLDAEFDSVVNGVIGALPLSFEVFEESIDFILKFSYHPKAQTSLEEIIAFCPDFALVAREKLFAKGAFQNLLHLAIDSCLQTRMDMLSCDVDLSYEECVEVLILFGILLEKFPKYSGKIESGLVAMANKYPDFILYVLRHSSVLGCFYPVLRRFCSERLSYSDDPLSFVLFGDGQYAPDSIGDDEYDFRFLDPYAKNSASLVRGKALVAKAESLFKDMTAGEFADYKFSKLIGFIDEVASEVDVLGDVESLSQIRGKAVVYRAEALCGILRKGELDDYEFFRFIRFIDEAIVSMSTDVDTVQKLRGFRYNALEMKAVSQFDDIKKNGATFGKFAEFMKFVDLNEIEVLNAEIDQYFVELKDSVIKNRGEGGDFDSFLTFVKLRGKSKVCVDIFCEFIDAVAASLGPCQVKKVAELPFGPDLLIEVFGVKSRAFYAAKFLPSCSNEVWFWNLFAKCLDLSDSLAVAPDDKDYFFCFRDNEHPLVSCFMKNLHLPKGDDALSYSQLYSLLFISAKKSPMDVLSFLLTDKGGRIIDELVNFDEAPDSFCKARLVEACFRVNPGYLLVPRFESLWNKYDDGWVDCLLNDYFKKVGNGSYSYREAPSYGYHHSALDKIRLDKGEDMFFVMVTAPSFHIPLNCYKNFGAYSNADDGRRCNVFRGRFLDFLATRRPLDIVRSDIEDSPAVNGSACPYEANLFFRNAVDSLISDYCNGDGKEVIKIYMGLCLKGAFSTSSLRKVIRDSLWSRDKITWIKLRALDVPAAILDYVLSFI